MEDKDTSTTELFLKEDRSIEFGQTDGPIWDDITGSWEVAPGTNDFKMSITKTYSTGQENTDMGEFSFEGTKFCLQRV